MADYIVHKAIDLDKLSKKAQADFENHVYLLSPKYDGCHAIFLFENGKHLATRSRTNEVVHSMDHIAPLLLERYQFLQWGKHAIQGEAWIPFTEFSEISGIFRRHYPQPQLAFVPFDTVHWRYDQAEDGRPVLGEGFDTEGKHYWDKREYDLRLGSLSKLGTPESYNKLFWPVSIVVESGDGILVTASTEAKRLKNLGGYDGAVLAKASGFYQVGAGKGGEFIKIKPLVSHTCICLDVERATGEKTGKHTGALVVQFNGKEQRVSTGLRQQEVDNIEQFIGKQIEVEAMGLTVNGLLREPRFRGIRTDVL